MHLSWGKKKMSYFKCWHSSEWWWGHIQEEELMSCCFLIKGKKEKNKTKNLVIKWQASHFNVIYKMTKIAHCLLNEERRTKFSICEQFLLSVFFSRPNVTYLDWWILLKKWQTYHISYSLLISQRRQILIDTGLFWFFS